MNFLSALVEYDFLRNALLASLLASLSFGMIGSLVVTQRLTYLAGAMAHCALGGIGLSLYAQSIWGWAWLTPMLGAAMAAALAAVLLWLVEERCEQRRDTVVSVIWTVGMAVGILLMTAAKTYTDPLSYLFGDILLISRDSLLAIGMVDIVVCAAVVIFYPIFLAISFDAEFAKLSGINTSAYRLIMLLLTAFTIIMLVYLVGIILAIALLTLPAAIAGRFTKQLWKMMLLSVLLSMSLCVSGLWISYEANMLTGPTIILLAAGLWAVTSWRRSR